MSSLHTQSADPASIMYIEHYLDVVENLPSNIARVMSRIHEIDIQRTKIAGLIDASLQDYLQNNLSENEKHKLLNKFLSMMIQLQNLSDTKICLAQAIYDQIDIKARQLESQGRGVPLPSTTVSTSQPHASTSSSNTSNINITNSNANSYANTNGTATSSARGAASGNNNSSSNNQTLNATLTRSESNNSIECKAPISTISKEKDAKEASTSASIPNHSNGNGKRTSRRSQGNATATATNTNNTNTNNTNTNNTNNNGKKDNNSKEDSNGGSGDDRSSTPVTTERTSSGTSKRGVASKRGVKGGRKANEGKRRKGSYNYNNNDDSPSAVYNSIDPDEPTYCLCEQVSYGEMICCDNSNCKIEWFHFTCVGLNSIPKGRWYCPECRGERSNIQKKPPAQ